MYYLLERSGGKMGRKVHVCVLLKCIHLGTIMVLSKESKIIVGRFTQIREACKDKLCPEVVSIRLHCAEVLQEEHRHNRIHECCFQNERPLP